MIVQNGELIFQNYQYSPNQPEVLSFKMLSNRKVPVSKASKPRLKHGGWSPTAHPLWARSLLPWDSWRVLVRDSSTQNTLWPRPFCGSEGNSRDVTTSSALALIAPALWVTSRRRTPPSGFLFGQMKAQWPCWVPKSLKIRKFQLPWSCHLQKMNECDTFILASRNSTPQLERTLNKLKVKNMCPFSAHVWPVPWELQIK